MAWFDYKVVPAPRRMKRAKGVSDHADLFALTLTDAINEHARQGWEYLRAETLSAETPGGWLRRGRLEEETVLVFRRERETLAPRLERSGAASPVAPAAREPETAGGIPQWVEPIRSEAAPARPPAPPLPPLRREPVVEDAPAPQPRRAAPPQPGTPQPDPHPGPRLGPAERG